MEPRHPELEESSTATVDEVLKPVEAPSDGEECPICLDQERVTTAWKETVCGHIFHEQCVERWLETKGSCPMCRRQLQEPCDAAKYGIRRSPLIMMAVEVMDNSDLPDRSNYFRQYRQETFVG
ncbi:hypothetical protein CFC21_036379 [Triticum aestivum]|nr:hypothetical protein CFC21_036379 [Triticum aestivum]